MGHQNFPRLWEPTAIVLKNSDVPYVIERLAQKSVLIHFHLYAHIHTQKKTSTYPSTLIFTNSKRTSSIENRYYHRKKSTTYHLHICGI